MHEENPEKSGTAYEIRLKEHLEPHWAAFFEGWTITNLCNGEVLLRNSDVDQSGLHGILNKIRDLNLKLISVNISRKKDKNMPKNL